MAPCFISLDGIDGTGKSTQCRMLADWLRRQSHVVTECTDPGGTAVGAELRAILLGSHHDLGVRTEALLFMASRAELVETVIRPALRKGEFVVSDRFLLANVVYQGYAGGLSVDQLWQVGEFSTGGLQPDLTIVLDLPVSLAIARRGGENDRLEARDITYHERVRQGFLTEASRRRDRIVVVDAAPSAEVIQQEIQTIVSAHLTKMGHRVIPE